MTLKFKIFIYFLILFLASFFGSVFLGSICVISFIFKPIWYRTLYDYAIGLWEWLAAGLLEKFLKVEVITTGDVIDSNVQGLLMMNHRTCFDWMYFWSVLIRQTKVYREKIVLKASLKNVPGAGWAMQGASFLFLRRKWEHDEAYLDAILNDFKSMNYKSQILMFPEGTDLNDESKLKSKTYAEENNFPVYEHVLHPRTTGFVHIANNLYEAWGKVYIYDVTVSYDSTPPQNELEILKGILPNRVYFHIKKYSMSDLPQTKEGLAHWCKEIWARKEANLRDLYTRKEYPENARRDSPLLDFKIYCVVSFWAMFIFCSICACWWYNYVLLYVVFTSCAYLFFTRNGGLEILTANCKTHIFYSSLKQ